MSYMTVLTNQPPEEGTALLTASFTDETGAAVTPNANTLKWTLTDALGQVINGRDRVAIDSAATVHLILTGDDLAPGVGGLQRFILLEWLYNSTYGNGLRGFLQGSFYITELIALQDA